jgi:tartrate dehydrogenase/decarboxylase/D-malate dehydrogenase
VHGSAPDIAGRKMANPIGQIWTAKMLLDSLNLGDTPDAVLDAIEDVLAAGIKTPDLGGRATTREVGDAIVERILRAR